MTTQLSSIETKNSFEKDSPTFTAKRIIGRARNNAIYLNLRERSIDFEFMTYRFMESISPDYSGGHWNFYNVSNGGFFMAPSTKSALSVSSPFGNFYEGSMMPTAAGISACIFTYAYLTEKYKSEKMYSMLNLLKDYASCHIEASKIFQLID